MSEASEKSGKAYWFSKNPSKAWGEKFFLAYIPFFILYNAVFIHMGGTTVGNFWHIVTCLLVWIPCLLVPPLIHNELSQGRKWYETYWFKFNLFHEPASKPWPLACWFFACWIFGHLSLGLFDQR